MNAISNYDLGWLVGILEGEGCFYLNQSRPNGTGTPIVQVRMTDEDTMNRVASLLEQLLGREISIRESDVDLSKQSQLYEIAVRGQFARTIMKLVVKRMSWRRRQRIWQCLNYYKQSKSTITAKDIVRLVVNG